MPYHACLCRCGPIYVDMHGTPWNSIDCEVNYIELSLNYRAIYTRTHSMALWHYASGKP